MNLVFFNPNQKEYPEINSSEEQSLIERNGQKLFDSWLGGAWEVIGNLNWSLNLVLILIIKSRFYLSSII